jgi:hypothetical protein
MTNEPCEYCERARLQAERRYRNVEALKLVGEVLLAMAALFFAFKIGKEIFK